MFNIFKELSASTQNRTETYISTIEFESIVSTYFTIEAKLNIILILFSNQVFLACIK